MVVTALTTLTFVITAPKPILGREVGRAYHTYRTAAGPQICGLGIISNSRFKEQCAIAGAAGPPRSSMPKVVNDPNRAEPPVGELGGIVVLRVQIRNAGI